MPFQRKNRKGKKEWYARITLPDGTRKEKRCATRREAMEWETLARARMDSRTPIDMDSMTMAILAERYLDNVSIRLGKNSYYQKRRAFRLLFQDVSPGRPVHTVRYGDVEAHLNKVAREVSGNRANKNRKHLVCAYNWGIKALSLPSPCPWCVETYKEERRPRYIPPVEDFWKVYAVADEIDRRMLLAYLHTGARMREVFNLAWQDVDLKERRIRLWTNKRTGGRECDWLPVTEELAEALKEQRRLTGLRQHVFINPNTGDPYRWRGKMMRGLCARAGVEPFGFHAIRHLSASILDEAGKPLALIQAVLRHKTAETTARYLHSLRGVREDLSEVFARVRQQGEKVVRLEIPEKRKAS